MLLQARQEVERRANPTQREISPEEKRTYLALGLDLITDAFPAYCWHRSQRVSLSSSVTAPMTAGRWLPQ
jgi:hypothetical protein